MDEAVAHRDYVSRVVRLMIWYVWNLSRRDPAVPVEAALEQHVDIMRKTSLFDGRHPADGLDPSIPEWDALRRCLASRIEQHSGASSEALEDACWEILAPLIEPHIVAAPSPPNPHGCWTYEIPEHRPEALDIHFVNAYRPASPFRDRRRDLAVTLLQLIDEANDRHPELSSIQCDSWLNQFPPFAATFPPAWHASMAPHGLYLATNGWWGQYKDERGAFHDARGSIFRKTGRHPYSASVCECGLEDAVSHLTRLVHAV